MSLTQYNEFFKGINDFIYNSEDFSAVEDEYNGYNSWEEIFNQLEEEYIENEYKEFYLDSNKELEKVYHQDYSNTEMSEKETVPEEKDEQDNSLTIVDLFSNLTSHQINRLKQYAENMETGNLGEKFVYEYERNELKGTRYYNKVDPTKAEVPMNGYDILSFTKNGDPIHIEVKATQKEEAENFFITDTELETAKYMESQGMTYAIYWVKDINSDKPILEKHYNILDENRFAYRPSKYIGEYLG